MRQRPSQTRKTAVLHNNAEQHTIVAIIPLYNGARFIEESVRSVMAQTRQPDEFIVVDDGSTDNGQQVVHRLMQEFPLLRLEAKSNGGQSSARNLGVKRSTGSLIALLDQDDAWYPNHLEELLKPFLKRRPNALGWSYSDLDEVDEDGSVVSKKILAETGNEHPKRRLTSCLGRDMFVLPSASLIARTAFEEVGGFDERLSGYEDDDLFLRLFRRGYDNVFVKKALSKWRIYMGSTSYSPRMAKSRMIYASKLLEMYPDNPKQGRHYARDLIAPRFVEQVIGDLFRALRAGRSDIGGRVAADLELLIPHLPLRRRVLFASALPVLRQEGATKTAYRLRVLLRPFLARTSFFH